MLPNYQQMYMPMYSPSYQMPMTPSFNQNNLQHALYVGDLDESITEDTLYTHFSKYGPIFYIKLARDPITKRSKGFAYVNFHNPRDAEKARSLSQYEKIGNKPIRVMYRKNNIKELHEGNLFVKNIDPTVTVKEIHNFFSDVGNVLSAKIATDTKGASLGYGYVQFEKGDDADKAIEKLSGTKLKDREINITHFASLGERLPNTKRNLYVKHLPAKFNQEELETKLKKIFEPYGDIEALLVKRNEQEDKYFAFVCYKNTDDAQKAFDYFTANSQDPFGVGLPLYVAWHQNKVERILEFKKRYNDISHQTNLYIKNLKPEATEEKLLELFSEYGQVNSVKVKEWKEPAGGVSKFGFVDFKEPADCDNALSNAGKNKEVLKIFRNQEPYIGLYQTREQRNKYLQTKNMFNPMMPLMLNSMSFFPNFGQQTPFAHPMSMQNSMPPQQYGGQGGFGGGNSGQTSYYGGGGSGNYQQQQYNNRGWGGQQGGNRSGGGGYYGNNSYNNYQRGGQKQYFPKKKFEPQGGMQGNRTNSAPGGQNMLQSSQETFVQKKSETESEFTTYEKIKGNLRNFLDLDTEKQRTILGNLLYPIILQREGQDMAPKITGMLVDLNVLEVNDVLEFFEDPMKLEERILEAKEIILQEQK
jgi:polyadenylate-binding protein